MPYVDNYQGTRKQDGNKMGNNFYIPMWLHANEPLTKSCCIAGCHKEYIYCEECGKKVYRTIHKAYTGLDPAIMDIFGLSHISSSIEYQHNCCP